MNKHIPDYLIDRNNIISYLIFVAFFSILFVNVFTPFQGAWYNETSASRADLFLFSVLIVLGGVVVMTLSRILMYYIHKKYTITVIQFITWLVLEVILIATIYTFGCFLSRQDTRSFSLVFSRAIMYVPLILAIPTLISYLYFGIKERDKTIKALTSATDNGLDMKEESSADVDNGDIVNFFDEKGELKLSVKSEYIYYVEAFDNYVNIYYQTTDEVTRFMLRSSMKKQEKLLESHGFVRCHRSFIVNFAKVALLRKDKDGPYLDLGNKDIREIPVSKTYLDSVASHFTYPR